MYDKMEPLFNLNLYYNQYRRKQFLIGPVVSWRVHTSSTVGNVCWWPTSWSGDNLTNQTGGPDNCGAHEQLKYLVWFWICPQLTNEKNRKTRGALDTGLT